MAAAAESTAPQTGPVSQAATVPQPPATMSREAAATNAASHPGAAPARIRNSAASAAWRAEVASRVSSYRARRQQSGELFPGQDFTANSPATPAPPTRIVQTTEASSSPVNDAKRASGSAPMPNTTSTYDPARKAEAVRQARAARATARRTRPFDTDYYRRVNAATLNGSALSQGSNALFAAITPEASVVVDPEILVENGTQQSGGSDFFDLPGASAAVGELPDLELRPVTMNTSALENLRIADTEAETATQASVNQPASVIVTSSANPSANQTPDNLIVFHRPPIEPPLVPRPSLDELAEPVNSRPRILEVPEDIMPSVQGSLFAEIHLDPIEVETPAPRAEIDVPLPVAEIGDRLVAGVADMAIVLSGGVLFSAGAWMALPDVPHNRPFFLGLAVSTVVLWAVYQHLFLMGAGQTPGMRLRGLRLSTFDGRAPSWRERANRAHFTCFSLASAALGFLWAYVDQDMLCWHDHVSRTFPTLE